MSLVVEGRLLTAGPCLNTVDHNWPARFCVSLGFESAIIDATTSILVTLRPGFRCPGCDRRFRAASKSWREAPLSLRKAATITSVSSTVALGSAHT